MKYNDFFAKDITNYIVALNLRPIFKIEVASLLRHKKYY